MVGEEYVFFFFLWYVHYAKEYTLGRATEIYVIMDFFMINFIFL